MVAYRQGKWVTSGHFERSDPRNSVPLFRMLRKTSLALLKLLKPKQWKLCGMHSEGGQQPIEDMVHFAGVGAG